MFVFEVEYLAGRAVATNRHERETAEWPPHPGRLFSALVAACHEADLTDAEREAGREALMWLENQAPPAIAVSEARCREVIPVFVPVNDVQAPDFKPEKPATAGQMTAAIELLPERRPRQPRFFPTVTPERATLHFVWRQTKDAERHRPALSRLAGCVTYLGHSSSLVRVSVTDSPGEITYEPAEDGTHVVRVPARGRLRELERDYARQARPSPGTYQAYRSVNMRKEAPAREPARSVFGDLLVCQIQGRDFLPLSGALRLTGAVRQAVIELLDRADTRVKALVSGHTDAGGVSKEDHVAYIPLAYVGHRYADGKIMGFAVVLPRRLARFSPDRREILRAVAGLEAIGFEEHVWKVTLAGPDTELRSLRTGYYTAASRYWASVTPVLCDRFPKEKSGKRIEDVIAESAERVVGIRPVRVVVDKISKFRGVPPSFQFHRDRKVDDVPRHRTHAVLEFDRAVRGPLLVGAGRFLGLGLFRAWDPDREGRQ